MSKKKATVTGVTVFIALIIFFTFFSNTISNYTLAKVTVANPKESSLMKQVSAKGHVEPVKIRHIYFQGETSADILSVNYETGDLIAAKDTIIKIEPVLNKTELEIELLKLEKMEYLYDEAVRDKESGSNLKAIEQSIASYERRINDLTEQYEQTKALYSNGAATLAMLIEAEKSLEEMKVLLNNSIENLEILKKNEDRALKEAKFNVDLQKLVVRQLQQKHKYSRDITAGFDGIIDKIYVNEGSRIHNGTLLLSVIEYDAGFEFVTEVDPDGADFIQYDDWVLIRITGWTGNNIIKGHVRSISDSTNNKGLKKEIILTLYEDSNNENKLTGYEQGIAYFEKETLAYSAVVPNSSLIPGITDELKYLWVLEEKKGFLGREYRVKKTEVRVIDEDNYYSAVEGSIQEDDRIVILTDKILKEGNRVLLKEFLE